MNICDDKPEYESFTFSFEDELDMKKDECSFEYTPSLEFMQIDLDGIENFMNYILETSEMKEMNEYESFLFDLSEGEERKMNLGSKHGNTTFDAIFIDEPTNSHEQGREFSLENVIWDDYDGNGCIMPFKIKMVLERVMSPMHVYAPFPNVFYPLIIDSHQDCVDGLCERDLPFSS